MKSKKIMKQIIAIYAGPIGEKWDEHSVLNGMPGSETWAAMISAEFARMGFHVMLFGNPAEWHFDASGVEYVPAALMGALLAHRKVDYFIFSRDLRPINAWIECPNVYVQAHDPYLYVEEGNPSLKLDKVKKICCVSRWQRDLLLSQYGLDHSFDGRFMTGFNGVDGRFYKGEAVKSNSMVFSSACDRDLLTLMRFVFPLVAACVPDFKVHICYGFERVVDAGRGHVVDEVKRLMEASPGMYEYHGNVSKCELAALQLSSKVWCYSPVAEETFCITAVENALAGNALVVAPRFGIRDTLDGYGYFLDLDDDEWRSGRLTDTHRRMAGRLVALLTNEELRRWHAESAAEVCARYTWENAAKVWVDEWEKDTRVC